MRRSTNISFVNLFCPLLLDPWDMKTYFVLVRLQQVIMGTCGSSAFPDIFPQLYKQYRPQKIEYHVLSMMVLQYFQTRKKTILAQAKDDINQIISNNFREFEDAEQKILYLYQAKKLIFLPSESASTNSNITNHGKLQIQIEIAQVRDKLSCIKVLLSKSFGQFQQQLLKYLSEQMEIIENNIKKGTVEIKYSNELKQQQLSEFFQRLSNTLSKKFRKYTSGIQLQLKTALQPQKLVQAISNSCFDSHQLISQLVFLQKIIININSKPKYEQAKGKLVFLVSQTQFQEGLIEIQNEKENERALIDFLSQHKEIVEEIKQAINKLKEHFIALQNKLPKPQKQFKKIKVGKSQYPKKISFAPSIK